MKNETTNMTTTQRSVSIKVTHNDDAINACGDLGRADLQLFTLKGRLEYSKDYKGVMLAAVETPGIAKIDYDWVDDNTVTLSWILGGVGRSEFNIAAYQPISQERINQVQGYVDTFIDNLIKVSRNPESYPALKEAAVELHVFIESLKPLEAYNGDRDGILQDYHRI